MLWLSSAQKDQNNSFRNNITVSTVWVQVRGRGRLAWYFIISQRKDKCLLRAVRGFVLAVALSFLASARYLIIHILIPITCERHKLRRACANAHFQ